MSADLKGPPPEPERVVQIMVPAVPTQAVFRGEQHGWSEPVDLFGLTDHGAIIPIVFDRDGKWYDPTGADNFVGLDRAPAPSAELDLEYLKRWDKPAGVPTGDTKK